jgi:predicted 3-demethylubiquinone-9 3-methyltransferase (glyoxalase superfamily)
MARTQKITTYLWFNENAEEAVEFYTSVFADSRVTYVARWGEGGPGLQGGVMNIVFELEGQPFIAVNGAPQFTFTPAISLVVSCESQAEVDDCGRSSSLAAANPTCAGGSTTATASPGKSFRRR